MAYFNVSNMVKQASKVTAKKLLYVVNNLGFFISHRLPHALAAQRAGYEVHVASPASDKLEELAKHQLIHHSILLRVNSINPIRELMSCFSLYRLYRCLKPDIVHHVTIKPIMYGGIVARLVGVPAVLNAISGLGYVYIGKTLRFRLWRACTNFLYRLAFKHPNTKVIFQNNDDKQFFLQKKSLSKQQCVLVRGSGVDIKQMLPLDEPTQDIIRVVLPSRLLWDKGIAEFVAAAKLVKQQLANIEFILVGDIDENNPASIKKSDVDSWVQQQVIAFWGWQTDMRDVFAKAHIVCLPSYREGLPKALLDAAACARAIVTTDVPGCREVVQHGVNGFLVPVKESKPLAEAIIQLAKDKVLRVRMGKSGRRIAEQHFSVTKISEQILALYQEIVARI